MARNRVIYQSQALFIAPNSTGAQVSGISADGTGFLSSPFTGSTTGQLVSGISLLKKMDRIQSCNFNFAINRQDINEFGKLARIDSIVMETPTIGLDFSYYVTDGFNERLMGFNITGVTDNGVVNGAQAVSGLLADLQGNNYYILTVDEGEDVVDGNLTPTSSIVSIGNGFISEYSFDASVGAIPTANVTVEAFNIKSDYAEVPGSVSAVASPAGVLGADMVFITGSSAAINLYSQPATKFTNFGSCYKLDYSRHYTGAFGAGVNSSVNFTGFTTGSSTVSALRPGDIVLTMPTSEGFTDLSQAHIQSFKFTIPLSRTVLQRLGNTFGFARVVNVPMNMDVTVSAIVSELRDQNIFDKLSSYSKNNFTITLKDSSSANRVSYGISGAVFQGESYSENIGDNQTVDLTYTVQIGGANDTANGLFMSGSYPTPDAIISGFYKLGAAKSI